MLKLKLHCIVHMERMNEIKLVKKFVNDILMSKEELRDDTVQYNTI